MRSDALEHDAKLEFVKQMSRMELAFIPTREAKKAHDELIALKTTLPMEIHDFEDWYESVIEGTCKRCVRDDFAECKTRRVLSKYGVYPIDPAAIEKCQYSYVGTPDQEELKTASTDTVPADVYNAALAVVKAKESSINEHYVPLIKQLQAELETAKAQLIDILYFEDDRPPNHSLSELITCAKESFQNCETQDREQMEEIRSLRAKVIEAADKLTVANEAERSALQQISKLQAAVAAQEQPKSEYPVSIGLASGGEFDYVLPAGMTETMIREIQKPRNFRSTCAQHVDGRLVAIDLQEVVALHVDKLPQGDWLYKKAAAGVTSLPDEQERYRVECKCGAEYFAEMNAGRYKARCRDCQSIIFADRQADAVGDPLDGKKATLLTNRYWVDNEPAKQREQAI